MDGYNKHNNNKIITQSFEIYPENLKKFWMISDLWIISTFQVIKESKFQTKKVNVSEQKDTTFIFLIFILTLTQQAERKPLRMRR